VKVCVSPSPRKRSTSSFSLVSCPPMMSWRVRNSVRALWEIGLFEKTTMIGRGVLTQAVNKTLLTELTLVYELTFRAVTE